MTPAPRWSKAQLTTDAAAARDIFRRERVLEPLAKWKDAFARYERDFWRVFGASGAADPRTLTPAQLAEIFKDEQGAALRYLAGPPISADDLKVLAETTIAPSVLAKDADASKRVIETILQGIDDRRFPWIAAKRRPTAAEKSAAVLASAAMLTSQRVRTDRANEGKEAQEAAVKAFLAGMGLTEVPVRTVSNMSTAPNANEFCGEALVGSRKADIVVRLDDGRLLPIECKVSNSSTNSVKRLNNDAQVKAAIWLREFGTNQIVPAAVLSGVFKVHNLEQAQVGGLTLFWAHKLDELRAFIEATQGKVTKGKPKKP